MDLWEKKKWLAAAVITCLCLGLSFFLSRPAPAEEGTLRKVDAVEERRQKKEPDGLCVYVSGAVQAPGLYRIPPGERFDYAIRKAGGVTEDADIDRVNLAKKCRDGSHVNVPFLSAAKRRKKAAMIKEGQSAGKTALPDERESGTGETGKGAGPVNVNTASVEELKGWLLSTPAGRKIPLSDVAEVTLEDSPQTLLRKDKRYYVQITAQSVEEYKKTAEADMKSFVENWQKPLGVESVANAQDESMKEEMGNLGNALITAIFLVFVVMAVQFESIKFSFMVMFTIPFSLIGSFGLLFLADCKISMISMIGFLMLVGTVVNNGILYVDTATHLRSESGDLDNSLVEAGAIRLRPIFMTTLTTIIAMVPMGLKIGKAGQYMQGLALVNIGGLVASTMLSLLLLPVLYRMMSQYRKKPDEIVDVD